MQRQRQRKKKVTFACGRRRRRWKRRKEHSQGKIQSDLQGVLVSLQSQKEVVMAGKSYSAKVKGELKLSESRVMHVIFAKGDQGSGLDSSERKLQRSMTGLLSCGTRQV
ncbi:hypothetical protein YC2023_045386 [Brassica napus]